jgi:glycosyltransferase involved in cell wall biosynthesis
MTPTRPKHPPTIALSTRTIGSHTGVSRAALDVLLALSRTNHEVALRAWVPHPLPNAVDGIALGPCTLQAISPLSLARSVLLGDAPPRSLPEHLRLGTRSALRVRAPRKAAPVLEVVNGLGAHTVHLAASTRQAGARIPSLLVVHESPRHFENATRASLDAALGTMRSYDYRVFVSERGRSEWNALGGLDPARSFYIPNCVQEQQTHRLMASDRKDLRRNLGYAPERMQVVCVGAVIARKGQDLVLAALRELADAHPDIHVDFLGPLAGGWASGLKSSLARSGLGGRARFLGSVSDVYERIYAADALVLASRAEAFPLSVLEAMALGTCVVASDVDGITEQVEHEISGLLFPREDVRALAQCLKLVATDPVRRRTLARAARTRYVTEFNRTLQLERWAEAIEVVLAGGRAGAHPSTAGQPSARSTA